MPHNTRMIGLCLALVSTTLSADELLPPDRSISDVVDHYVNVTLEANKVTAAESVDDAGFVRRVTLDLVGRIPARIESREFVASRQADKREWLIERLMSSPDFIDQQATQFDGFVSAGSGSVKNYFAKAFRENRDWRRMFRDLMQVGQPDKVDRDAIEFLKQRVKDTDRLTNDVSIAFFGINISCAKCHDHPLVENWKQDHFFGLKSFFNRTFESGGFIAEREFGLVSFKTTKGDTRNAKLMFLTGALIKEPDAKEPDGKTKKQQEALFKKLAKEKKAPPAPKFSRRDQLVETALQPGQNDFFARSIVNRLWHQYFGFGLVMPLDQMHSENPASHPELLKWLARDLVAHEYDLQRLIRGLLLSDAYARTSRWSSETRPSQNLFAVANVRPLTPMQLARSLSLAAADPDSFNGDLAKADVQKRIADSAANADAGQFELPNENFQVSADEALFFSNSPEVSKRYLSGGLLSRVQKIEDSEAAIRMLVETILSRVPSDEEIAILSAYLKPRADRRNQALQQLGWSLLTSSEFRFNH